MRKPKFHIFALPMLAVLMAVMTGCHDEPDMPDLRSEITTGTNGYVTSFTLHSKHFLIPDDVDSLRITLVSEEGLAGCYNAGVKRELETTRFSMHIPESAEIKDGKYILTMRRCDGKSVPGRLSAQFDAGMLTNVAIIIPKYMLDGEGTEENPYLINNDDDFAMFLINLCDDEESYGAGLKFKQTADLKAPDQSSLIPGRGYWGAPFAGIYDGGGHTVSNLYYHGSGRESSDSGIGLFSELTGSAEIMNLKVAGVAMSGLYKDCGIVAGYSNGDVSMSGISIAGNVDDGDAVGGIVGNVKGGTLSLSDIEMHVNMRGENYVGGLVGFLSNGASLEVRKVRIPDYHFSVNGKKSVGGILGCSKGYAQISDVRLEHKVSSEDSDINIIEGSAGDVGGIIGTIASDGDEHRLSSCYILCPVGGKHATNVGGMVGYSSQSTPLVIDACRMYSVINGSAYIGGIIGQGVFPHGTYGITVEGDDFSTRIAADDAEAKISGGENAGGFAGLLKGSLHLGCKVKINLPVSGTTNVGGAFGSISGSTVDVSGFMFGQSTTSGGGTTMRVTGTESTGGFVGDIYETILLGSQKFDYSENGKPIAVPSPDRFEPTYNCVVSGVKNVGGIVGCSRGSDIRHISSAAAVTGSSNVGGIVGSFEEHDEESLLEDCTFKGSIDCKGAKCVGGIVGSYLADGRGTIKDCVNYSDISGGDYTGGIIGNLYKRSIVVGETISDFSNHITRMKWCVNKGAVDGTGRVGGIVGLSRSDQYSSCTKSLTSISDCMNAGKITAKGSDSSYHGVGGIVGKGEAHIEVLCCANHGDIFASGRFHGVGGIAGSLGMDANGVGLTDTYRNLDMKECCNTATVDTDNRDNYVGGILGYQEEGNKSDVNDCHNLGAVPCKQSHDSGGVVGIVDHLTNIYRCVNQGMVSHGNAAIGTHKSGSLFDHGSLYYLDGTGKSWPSASKVSAANFGKAESFKGLDFNNKWTMTTEGPVLRNCQWHDPAKAR